MTSIGQPQFPHFSFEEYLEKDSRSNEKLEYLHGVVYAMPGGTQFHNAIGMNFALVLAPQLRGKDCRVMSSDQMLETPGQEAGYYPDLLVVCGVRLLPRAAAMTAPVLVLEVLSPSTKAYDLGQKLQQYRRIPSLRHIVFVDSSRVEVQIYTRGTDEVWPGTPETLTELTDSLVLAAFGADIPLREVYSDIDF